MELTGLLQMAPFRGMKEEELSLSFTIRPPQQSETL